LTKWQGEVMRGLMRRVAVVAGGVVVLGSVAGMAAGVAAATADPPVLAFSQSSHDYGSVTVGKKVSQVFTLTNSGGTASRALKLSLSGSGAFSITSDRCRGRSLGPLKSCTVEVKFAPAGAGPVTATLTATGVKRPVAATVSLSGTGVVPGHLYWVIKNERGDLINEAGLDGSNPQTLITGLDIDGLAVSGSHMYWTEKYGSADAGVIMEAGLDGSNPQTLVTGQDNPYGVVVYGSHIYWADESAGTIMEAGLDGSNPQALITGLSDVYDVAAGHGHIYWADTSAGTLSEANLDGTGVTTLITYPNIQDWLTVHGSHIYWGGRVPLGGPDDGAGTIMESALDGSNPQTLYTNPSHVGQGGVAVYGGHIYWSTTWLTGGGVLMEAGLDGSNPQDLTGTGSSDPEVWVAVSSR
jgi:hypothetical protein